MLKITQLKKFSFWIKLSIAAVIIDFTVPLLWEMPEGLGHEFSIPVIFTEVAVHFLQKNTEGLGQKIWISLHFLQPVGSQKNTIWTIVRQFDSGSSIWSSDFL